MMSTIIGDIFKGIPSPSSESSDGPIFAVVPVPGHSSYFVGKDADSLACLLITAGERAGRSHSRIRLESLDAQFDVRCSLKREGDPDSNGVFTVIRCRDGDPETTHYFLSICESIIRMLGECPSRIEVAVAVNRLAAIFQRILRPPTRPLTGLFGELYLILRSSSALGALAAWRSDENARFDFAHEDARLEVKATDGRRRNHTFSYDQCNPPSGTITVVASLYVELVAGGSSLRSVIGQIESRVSAHSELVLKLHETVAATLGTGLKEGLSRCFDAHLAESSLQCFSVEEIPAIRGPLPTGVSNVHFSSDLSSLKPLSIAALIEQAPAFQDLLAHSNNFT